MIGYKKPVNLPYDQAVARAREELGKEVGACNPPFAYQALKVIKDVGLMMPCNVIVFTQEGKTFVEAATPTVLMDLIQNKDLRPIAQAIEGKLKKAIDNIN